jgi:hypothetical protein
MVVITQHKILITITRTCIVLIGFIPILLAHKMDQVHIMQVIRIQVTGMGITLITSIMAAIIMPHLICKTVITETPLELMPPPTLMFIWMAMFTGIQDLGNINPMSRRGQCITLSMLTIQHNIVLEVQQEQQEQQVIQELLEQTVLGVQRGILEQTVLEDLLLHHLGQGGLA